MADTYSTVDLSRVLDVSLQTIRNYTKEYARHLSPTATPPKGQTREYTESDAHKLALVADLMRQHFNADEIHAALERGDTAELPGRQATLSADAAPTAQLIAVMKQRDVLSGQLEATRRQLEDKQGEIDRHLKRIEDLSREIGKLQGQIEALTAKDD